MYERLEECPACKHTQFTNFLICEDHSVSHESFALVKCTKCELTFTNPRPTEETIGKYYKDANYISHTNKANNLTNLLYKIVRNITLHQKRTLIKKLSSGHRLLDFGCGAGSFLEYMNDSGFETIGYEPSSDANNQDVKSSITIHSNINHLKKENKFDIITAWHVLEHVHQQEETVKTLRSLLKENGVLIIAVPNLNSYDAQYYKSYWAAYDVPRHLYHFSQTSIEHLFHKRRMKLQSIHPMPFDSFYVSLLSEKYKNKQSNLISAFKIGLQSNRKAKSNQEYSSLIYIFKK